MRRGGPVILLLPLLLLACAEDPPKTAPDARALLAEGKQREARNLLLALAGQEKTDALARAELAELLISVRETRRAHALLDEELFATLLAERGEEAWTHRLHGLWLLGRDRETALLELKKALSLDEEDPVSWAYLGSVLQAIGRDDEAAEVLKFAAGRFPDSPEVRASLAALLMARRDADEGTLLEAVRLLEPVARERPLDRQARYNLSTALRETGQNARAEQVAEALCEEWPDEPAHWTALGRARQARGNVEEAVEAFEKAARLAPRDLEALLNLGEAYLRLVEVKREREGAASSARRVFERAAKLAPGDPRVYVGLARASVKMDPASDERVEEAVRFYRKALKIDPRCFEALLNLALILYDRIPAADPTGEEYRRAMELFERAAEQVPPEKWERNARRVYEELKKRGR